jgi:hypothetical protein
MLLPLLGLCRFVVRVIRRHGRDPSGVASAAAECECEGTSTGYERSLLFVHGEAGSVHLRFGRAEGQPR